MDLDMDAEYLTRLRGDGLRPYNNLLTVVVGRLNALSKSRHELTGAADAAMFNGLALLALTAVVWLLEDRAFICLLSGTFAVWMTAAWFLRSQSHKGIVDQIEALEALLRRANFDVDWMRSSPHEVAEARVSWKVKEARHDA
jgi:hypothetical protein